MAAQSTEKNVDIEFYYAIMAWHYVKSSELNGRQVGKRGGDFRKRTFEILRSGAAFSSRKAASAAEHLVHC